MGMLIKRKAKCYQKSNKSGEESHMHIKLFIKYLFYGFKNMLDKSSYEVHNLLITQTMYNPLKVKDTP